MVPFVEFVIGVLLLVICVAFFRLAAYLYAFWMYKSTETENNSRRNGEDWENGYPVVRIMATSSPTNQSVPLIPDNQNLSQVPRALPLQHSTTTFQQEVYPETEIRRQSIPIVGIKNMKRCSVVSLRFVAIPPSAPPLYEPEDPPPPYEEACSLTTSSQVQTFP